MKRILHRNTTSAARYIYCCGLFVGVGKVVGVCFRGCKNANSGWHKEAVLSREGVVVEGNGYVLGLFIEKMSQDSFAIIITEEGGAGRDLQICPFTYQGEQKNKDEDTFTNNGQGMVKCATREQHAGLFLFRVVKYLNWGMNGHFWSLGWCNFLILSLSSWDGLSWLYQSVSSSWRQFSNN